MQSSETGFVFCLFVYLFVRLFEKHLMVRRGSSFVIYTCHERLRIFSFRAQNSKYKLEGKILHQQCNRLFPARCQTYAN